MELGMKVEETRLKHCAQQSPRERTLDTSCQACSRAQLAAVSSGPRTNVVLGKGLVNEGVASPGVSDFTPSSTYSTTLSASTADVRTNDDNERQMFSCLVISSSYC